MFALPIRAERADIAAYDDTDTLRPFKYSTVNRPCSSISLFTACVTLYIVFMKESERRSEIFDERILSYRGVTILKRPSHKAIYCLIGGGVIVKKQYQIKLI